LPPNAGGPLETKFREYLTLRFQSDKLTPPQFDRFYTQSFIPIVHVRPRIVVGDELPIWVAYAGLRNGGEFKVENPTATVAGQTLERHPVYGGPLPSYRSRLTSVKVTIPGTYWITIEEDLYANLKPTNPHSTSFPWKRHIVLQKKIEVLDKAPDDLITWVEHPNAATIRQAISLDRVVPEDLEGRFMVTIRIVGPPANLAFDVVARDQGKDYPLGQVAVRKNGYISQDLYSKDLTGRWQETLDLQFRSSESAARNTTDLFEVWKGVFSLPTKPTRR
jgi:hypothetical protein